MSVKNMTLRQIYGDKSKLSWEYEASLTSAVTGDTILIPSDVTKITVAVIPTAGTTAHAEYMADTIARVMAGTATWLPWPDGNVTSVKVDKADLFTAIRLVQNTSGSSYMSLLAY